MTHEDFVKAMTSAANNMDVMIDKVAQKAPIGYWDKVAVIVDMKDKEASRRYWNRNRAELLELLGMSPESINGHDTSITREEVLSLMDSLRAEILGLIRSQPEIAGAKDAAKPKIPKIGRKYAGLKADVRALIDLALHDLLIADARTNHNGNVSSCLDKILWNFYGHPALSFDWPSEELERRKRKVRRK